LSSVASPVIITNTVHHEHGRERQQWRAAQVVEQSLAGGPLAGELALAKHDVARAVLEHVPRVEQPPALRDTAQADLAQLSGHDAARRRVGADEQRLGLHEVAVGDHRVRAAGRRRDAASARAAAIEERSARRPAT
jgi:hypothetical protein